MEPEDEREEANRHAPIELITPEDLERWGWQVENDKGMAWENIPCQNSFEPMSRDSKKVRRMRQE